MKNLEKFVVICLLVSVVCMPLKSSTDKREDLDTITRKVDKMKKLYDMYLAGEVKNEGEVFTLTTTQKNALINKYNTLKAELKTIVADL